MYAVLPMTDHRLLLLKRKPHHELNPARRIPLRCHLAKVGTRDVSVRALIRHIIQRIDEVHAELHFETFRDGEVPCDVHIHLIHV